MDTPDPDAILAELAAQGREPAPAIGAYGQEISASYARVRQQVTAQASNMPHRPSIARVRYTHEDCIDRILMSPGISQNELAQLYGVTVAWMSIVVNSDAFKVKLAERREELIDPALLTSLNERYGAMAARSVEVLLEKLSKPVEQISDKLALEAAALGAKAVGLGEPKPAGGGNAVDHLAALAHRLVDLNKPTPQVVEGETRRLD